jgi:hypothetical protein
MDGGLGEIPRFASLRENRSLTSAGKSLFPERALWCAK